MRLRTCIGQAARQRGRTAAEVARSLKLYRSNLSAMDAGRRSISLQALARIARFLNCSPADLLISRDPKPLFSPRLDRLIEKREQETPAGAEKGWVDAVSLAWQRHYRKDR